ncbi:hypothetical protein SN811_00550 [Ligilactobacillus agilis]|uniref:HTH-type transcriptional regulator Rgg C-terminal domain-containing protein n=1 Tax=Ligilactobacillus agilis TaxID=1601 RepID=A0A6F9Y2D5_9LACO|nr:hypothetical protein [Ligilactobacillus agilis]GET11555.1 hypothetical protein SN811_00550 [Ligilactobacillus agilis]
MQNSDFGKTISYIRKKKAIPVKEVIGEKLTRSAYSRFASGQTQTSIENFSYMLSNLHVNFEEFEYIKNDYEPNRYQKFLIKAQKAAHLQNIEELKYIYEKLNDYAKINNDMVPLHFSCIVKLTINKIRGEEYDKYSRETIINYLKLCESWTHYELMLFNNAMFIFDLSLVKIMKRKVIHNLEKYQNLRSYGSESFRVLINILTLFIDNNMLNEAVLLVDEIEEFHLRDDMFFEKTLRMYFMGIIQMIRKKRLENILLEQSMDVLRILSNDEYYKALLMYIEKVKKMYKINIVSSAE